MPAMKITGLFLVTLSLFAGIPAAYAQDESAQNPAQTEAIAKPLPAQLVAQLDAEALVFDRNRASLEDLEERVEQAEGVTRDVLSIRFDRRWIRTLKDAIRFAIIVADQRDAGFDVSAYEADVRDIISSLPVAVALASDRIASRVKLPDTSATAAEQAATDQKFFAAVELVYETNKVLIDAIETARRFDLDVTNDEAYIQGHVTDMTKNASVYLDIAQSDVAGLKASTSMLPDDAELKAKKQVAVARVKEIAVAIQNNLFLMQRLGLETSEYKQQLLTATGELTSNVFDLEVLTGLVEDWGNAILQTAAERGPDIFFKIILFVGIFYVFVKLSQLVRAGAERALDSSSAQVSKLLRAMILSGSKNFVIFIGIMIALSQLGLSLGPLLTGLGIAGFIVGFALQDSLSNFASGLMILFYRPFDVGDTIEAGGARGRVNNMTLVNTTILTFDNQRLVIPNNKIWQDVIINVTYQTQRRIDMEFGITYSQNIDEVFEVLLKVVNADDRVLSDPEADVKVGSFGDSSVNILCRPWVKTADYWEVYWDLNKQVKDAFDEHGIEIPFPQRDVHIYEERILNTTGSKPESDGSAS